MSGWKYEFKVNYDGKAAQRNWLKIFVSIDDLHSFDCKALVSRIREKCNVREINRFKYLDADQDWVDLPIDDYETFIDMVETAQVDNTRENIKKITLKICEKEVCKRPAKFSPVVAVSGAAELVPDYSPSKPQRKKTKLAGARRLLSDAVGPEEVGCTNIPDYVSPTQRYFNKLTKEIEESGHELGKKRDELLNVEQSFIENTNTPNRALCTICHAPGHNRSNCNFTPCPSATICKQVKRHGEEEKYLRSIRTEIKAKTKKLSEKMEELKNKKATYACIQGTFSSKVQADLINSKPDKYLRKTLDGGQVPNWLLVNSDTRKLEQMCKGNIPSKEDIQSRIQKFDEEFSTPISRNKDKPSESRVNPAVNLWKLKGVKFPGAETLPNKNLQPTKGDRFGFKEPESVEEENLLLRQAIDESMALYNIPTATGSNEVSTITTQSILHNEAVINEDVGGLNLLFEAANILDGLI